MVARRPFCFRVLRRVGVLPDGPSSKVSPTYPLQVAACAGAAVPMARVPAAARATTASLATKERNEKCGADLM